MLVYQICRTFLKWQVLCWGISNRQGREAGWWLSTCSGRGCPLVKMVRLKSERESHIVIFWSFLLVDASLALAFSGIFPDMCQAVSGSLHDARWWCQLRFLGCLCLHISGSKPHSPAMIFRTDHLVNSWEGQPIAVNFKGSIIQLLIQFSGFQ